MGDETEREALTPTLDAIKAAIFELRAISDAADGICVHDIEDFKRRLRVEIEPMQFVERTADPMTNPTMFGLKIVERRAMLPHRAALTRRGEIVQIINLGGLESGDG